MAEDEDGILETGVNLNIIGFSAKIEREMQGHFCKLRQYEGSTYSASGRTIRREELAVVKELYG